MAGGGCSSRARRSFRGRRARRSTRLYRARRLGALHAAGADRARRADRRRARRVRLPDRGALRDAVRGRVASSGSAGSCSCSGRFAVVAVHETGARADDGVVRAPGRARRAEARSRSSRTRSWTRRRRGSSRAGGGSRSAAAGPVSDFSLGAVFSLCALLLPGGHRARHLLQLAFAAYVGAFFNLNPFIERDGYHMLVDWLRRAGAAAAREGAVRAPAVGPGRATATRRCWRATRCAGSAGRCSRRCFAIAMTLRYKDAFLRRWRRSAVVYGVMGDAVGGVLRAGGRRARQAAAGAAAGAMSRWPPPRSRRRRPADRAPARRPGVPRALPARPGRRLPRGRARRARRRRCRSAAARRCTRSTSASPSRAWPA